MDLHLTELAELACGFADQQAELLLGELDRIIEGDRYPLSPRVTALREIRAPLKPYPECLSRTPGEDDARRRSK